MATKITFDEVARKIHVEKSKENTIVQFTPRIIVELRETGKLWTTSIKQNAQRQ